MKKNRAITFMYQRYIIIKTPRNKIELDQDNILTLKIDSHTFIKRNIIVLIRAFLFKRIGISNERIDFYLSDTVPQVQ